MKVLNLYAGIGGNRKLWPDGIEVTAVEINPDIAKVYADLFPNDKVIVADAHQYLLEHYKEYDFIWSSPPCPTHSRANNYLNAQGVVRYPDMKLYQEIIFLKHFFDGVWVVENVISYYEPLVRPFECARHYFWSSFNITPHREKAPFNVANARATTRQDSKTYEKNLSEWHGFDLSKYDVSDKRLLLRNCVNPRLGLHVWQCAFKNKQQVLNE